jgi:uncharacterized membrane protein
MKITFIHISSFIFSFFISIYSYLKKSLCFNGFISAILVGKKKKIKKKKIKKKN